MIRGFKVFVKKWFISVRPFSFPASVMPLLFGTAAAGIKAGYSIDIINFLVALVAMIFLHSATNLLNDFHDYNKKLDIAETPVSGGIMKGLISPAASFRGSIVLYTLGIAIGLYLVYVTGPVLLYIGIAGVIIGIFYTQEKVVSLKYSALGDAAVFVNFGVLGTLGAWVIQTGTFSWIPVVWSVPMGLLVIAILHANNWRDINGDRSEKIKTVAMILGDKGSLLYYAALLIAPFLIILFLMVAPLFFDIGDIAMPFSFGIVFLALPAAVNLIRRAETRFIPERVMEFVALDGSTAQFNTLFGLLCLASIFAFYGLTFARDML